MDILISILVVAAVLGLSGLALYFKDKHIYNPADIVYVQSLFNISMDIIDELNLKQEPQIKLIAKIVSDCLNQVLAITNNVNETELETTAMKTITDTLATAKIELTPQRQIIIQGLIDIALDNIGQKIV